jgi:predicted adenine nucleotide alpha hydrolase (AANH) superfamily ATPase
MRILLHTCCAPCLIGPYESLTVAGHDVTVHFRNPNIHPLIEFRRRLKAMKVLQERMPFDAVYEEDYGLAYYLRSVRWDGPHRCRDCYRLRLEGTAGLAARRGFDAFATTLLGSTHQDHELIARTAHECAAAAGATFLAKDWRPLAADGHRRAKEWRLYLQQYCGCIFSEWERYRRTTTHLYRGGCEAG